VTPELPGQRHHRRFQLKQLLALPATASDFAGDVELDVVDGQVVGVLEHYGPVGAGWWLWSATPEPEARAEGARTDLQPGGLHLS
jgi:hypothetical protein